MEMEELFNSYPELKDSEVQELMKHFQESEHLRERTVNMMRTLHPGSYVVDDSSIIIDKSLPPIMRMLVIIHEFMHAHLSHYHYGEMIRRLEAFGQLVITPLNILRGLILMEAYRTQFGQLPTSPEQFKKFSTDSRLRQTIRQELKSDHVFMQALHFLDGIERRKEILFPQWKKTQEGGAYWLSLDMLEGVTVEATKLVSDFRSRLLEIADENGEGFRMIQKIAETWGKKWILPVLQVCLSPDITRVSILRSPIPEIERELSTPRLSPDKRLHKIYQMAISRNFTPNETNFFEVYRILDYENPNPPLTIDRFNKFWNSLDADPDFVKLMNALLQRVGIEKEYQPVQIPLGEGASNSPLYAHATVTDKRGERLFKFGGEGTYQKEYERILRTEDELVQQLFPNELILAAQKLSRDKKLLLQTMRKDGII